ncbi:MAG: Abi family protein [Pseudomonadota bacterium]
MNSEIYKDFCSRDLENALSYERFARYTAWADNDKQKALYLYGLNTALSEALYTPLQMLEVTMRNRFHSALKEAINEYWFDKPALITNPHQREQLNQARQKLRQMKKETSSGRIIAELTFGFWTAFVGRKYEDLWQRTLHKAAKQENGKGLTRKQFSEPLTNIRRLRNRVAHHEPILHWPLQAHYQDIIQLTRWLCPDAADWCEYHSRFNDVFPKDGILINGVQE